MSDLISRQDALDLVKTNERQLLDSDALYMAIEDLPPAEPERKKSWAYFRSTGGEYGYWACSQCNEPISPYTNYCAACGAKMGGKADADTN